MTEYWYCPTHKAVYQEYKDRWVGDMKTALVECTPCKMTKDVDFTRKPETRTEEY